MAQSMSPVAYANMPTKPPPAGQLSDFEHGEDRAFQAYVGMSIGLAITMVFVTLRLYVKMGVTRICGWDDLACAVGYIAIVSHAAVTFSIMGPMGPLGHHVWDVRMTSITKRYLQSILAALNLYAASAFCVKLSLFIFYLRIFKPNRITRWLVYGGIVACGLFYSSSIIINCATCMPKPGQPNDQATWLMRAQECSSTTNRLAIAQATFGTLSDIYLLVVPIGCIFKLQMPLQRKLGISGIFMVGMIAIACSLGSLGYRVRLLTKTDQTWFAVPVYIFTEAEIFAGIICSCLPVIATLFRPSSPHKLHFAVPRYFPSSWFRSRGSQSSGKAFVSEEGNSADRLQPASLDYENKAEVELENGEGPRLPENVIRVTRGVEVDRFGRDDLRS